MTTTPPTPSGYTDGDPKQLLELTVYFEGAGPASTSFQFLHDLGAWIAAQYADEDFKVGFEVTE